MAGENSFDIVSKVEMQEVRNAVDQAMKEIGQRFDFKGSKSNITLDEKEKEVILISDDEQKLKSVIDILQTKIIKEGYRQRRLCMRRLRQHQGAR